MARMLVILICLAGVLGLGSGCSQLEKEVDYGNMTGGIPQDSGLSWLGSGKNQGSLPDR